MDRDKIRAKVLNMIDHTPFEPASLPKQQSQQPKTQTTQPLSMSKSTISRQSYLNSPDDKYQQISKELQPAAKSVSKGKKKRYLNIMTNPHSQSLHKLKKENIVLTQNKLTLSRMSRSGAKNEQSQANQQKLTRNNSIKSVLSIQIPSQKQQPNPNITQRIIVKQKIVPVLVHSNQNAPFFQKQQLLPSKPNLKIDQYQHNHNIIYQNNQNIVNQKLNLQTQQQMVPMRSHLHLKPQQHMNLPQQLVNIQVMEPQIKLVPYNQSCILPSQRSKIIDTPNQHNTSTEFFFPKNETPRPHLQQYAHRAVINPAMTTPIRAYSPSQNNFTPIQIIQRSSIQKRQIDFNQQIIHKLGSVELYQNRPYAVQNQPQKVLKVISDSNTNNPYPIIRTISKRELTPQEISPQPSAKQNKSIVNISFCPNVSLAAPQRQKVVNECEIPMKFMNTPSRSSKKQNKHILKHSPKPIKQISSQSIHLNNDLQKVSRKSPRQSISSEISSKSKQAVNISSFFAEAKESSIMPRQNTFLINLRGELEQIQSKRKQSESRISRKLDELSERTSSLVKICEEDLKIPINRTVLSLSHRNNCMHQSFCSKQNYSSKKSVQLNLKLNKQNQQQGLYLRQKIISRIFS